MRISLTPRTSEFYDLFGKAGENALQVARLVERRFREHPNSGITQEQVKKEETEGDAITRDLITLLNTQYVTPFDREDILAFINRLDDVVDLIEEVADTFILYGVEAPTPVAAQQVEIIVRQCEQIADALANLKNFRGLDQFWIEIHRLENEGDRIVRRGIAELFKNGGDPVDVIKWKDLYTLLEEAVDACEDVANVIERIVVKHA